MVMFYEASSELECCSRAIGTDDLDIDTITSVSTYPLKAMDTTNKYIFDIRQQYAVLET